MHDCSLLTKSVYTLNFAGSVSKFNRSKTSVCTKKDSWRTSFQKYISIKYLQRQLESVIQYARSR
jgi:hypothetical protein